jgi:hypothetical protein
MSMTGTTTTAISPVAEIELTARTPYAGDADQSNVDAVQDIVTASRAQDEGVPDGGYGWVVVAACSMLCFWFGEYPYALL